MVVTFRIDEGAGIKITMLPLPASVIQMEQCLLCWILPALSSATNCECCLKPLQVLSALCTAAQSTHLHSDEKGEAEKNKEENMVVVLYLHSCDTELIVLFKNSTPALGSSLGCLLRA